MRLLRLLMLVALLLLAAAPAARGQAVAPQSLREAAEGLRSDTVFVDPSAENALDEAEAEALRERIEAAGGRIYVAVLPGDADGPGKDAEGFGALLAREVGRPGVHAVVIGSTFAAGDLGERIPAAQLAAQSLAERPDSAVELLDDFVARVGAVRKGQDPQSLGEGAPGGGDGNGGGGGVPGAGLLLVLAGAGGLLLLRSRRRGKARVREDREQWTEVRDAARDDLVALGDDIRALDLDVQMPGADARAKEDYASAVQHYERASDAFDRASGPGDLEEVSSALEQGRYAMAAAKARLEGREPPEHRPPCFFDPRHGPSVRDVEWSPPDGAPRPVPACAADAVRVEDGEQPATREVLVGGRSVPYYDAPPMYGPWAGGFFGGMGGGLLPGLLLGSMLGGGLGLGMAHPDEAYGSEEGAGDWGGGDFGDHGGGWGGGDFGGGGGDFGGGDFGGGGE
jgi:hypothetical protein